MSEHGHYGNILRVRLVRRSGSLEAREVILCQGCHAYCELPAPERLTWAVLNAHEFSGLPELVTRAYLPRGMVTA